jgi:hypothetical protein
MISNMKYTQRAVISLARSVPMATQEIAHLAAYRGAPPVNGWFHGMTLPVANFKRSRIAPAPAVLITVGDRNEVLAVPGSAPRGRPV